MAGVRLRHLARPRPPAKSLSHNVTPQNRHTRGEPNFSFGEWLKSFVLDIAPSTLSDDAKEKCKNDIDIVLIRYYTLDYEAYY